jgi:hypothetical protein
MKITQNCSNIDKTPKNVAQVQLTSHFFEQYICMSAHGGAQ